MQRRASQGGYQPVVPDGGQFKAPWPPTLRQSILSRALDLLMWPSPLLFLLAITIVRNTWFSLLCFYLVMRLMGNQLHHTVSKIVFPATLIGKDYKDFGWLHRQFLDSNVEGYLIGEAGREILRGRKQVLLDEYGGESVSITTCDDVVLDGAWFPGSGNSQPSDPTMIFFAANMQLYENPSSRQYLRMYTQMAGFNVLMFNYRGVSESQGQLTQPGTVLDGEAVFEYVTQQLGVPEEHVILHGRSIGGGVSLAVAGNHPRVCVCNERSFASLYLVILVLFRGITGVDQFVASPTDTLKTRLKQHLKVALVYGVAGLARCIGWDYESAQNWSRVVGYKWVFYHPQDSIIPLEASLYHSVTGITEPFYRWRMEGDPLESHNRPLSDEEENWNLNMMAQGITRIDREQNRSFRGDLEEGADDI